jgi:predicted anti-sigma-YlaC factor YlaD
MNCTESHDLLQRRLDGEPLADRAALDQHLSACPDCRLLHGAVGRLEDGLRLLTPPVMPPTLTGTIVDRLFDDHRQRLRLRRWLTSAALAASLLLAVYLGSVAWSSWGSTPQSARVVGPFKAKAPEQIAKMPTEDGANTPSVRGSLIEVGSAFASLTRRTASVTVGESKLLLPDALPAAPLAESPALQFELEPPAQSWKQASDGVAAALDPVTTSARRAFGMFLRERPAENNQ